MLKTIVLSLISITLFAQKEVNYFDYHKKINKAEILYFTENRTDSTLLLYDEVFNAFDFIFLKDLLTAAQIAKFNNKPYEKYLLKCFEFGFKIDHLKRFPLFKETYAKFCKDKKILALYKESRKKYLQKIDFVYLDYIYETAIQDQIDKYEKDYEQKVNRTIVRLVQKIRKHGFPGEKILGVTHTLIFKEAGISRMDINDRARKNKRSKHFVYKSNRISCDVSIPLFLHHRCSFIKYKDLFLEEIKKGNMHPQDLAFINDFNAPYYIKATYKPSYCMSFHFEGIYTFSPATGFLSEPKKIAKANKLRAKLYMIPYEVMQLKKKYAKDNNFILNFGYDGAARM